MKTSNRLIDHVEDVCKGRKSIKKVKKKVVKDSDEYEVAEMD